MTYSCYGSRRPSRGLGHAAGSLLAVPVDALCCWCGCCACAAAKQLPETRDVLIRHAGRCRRQGGAVGIGHAGCGRQECRHRSEGGRLDFTGGDSGLGLSTAIACGRVYMPSGHQRRRAYFKQCVAATAPPKWDASSQAVLYSTATDTDTEEICICIRQVARVLGQSVSECMRDEPQRKMIG